MSEPLALSIPENLVDEIARRAAELVLEQLQPTENGTSPFLTIPEAAELLRAKRHRVDDLLSRGTLTRVKDGTRTLIARAELEAYLRGEPTGRAAQ
jgi:excisionase family DNA binding protein